MDEKEQATQSSNGQSAADYSRPIIDQNVNSENPKKEKRANITGLAIMAVPIALIILALFTADLGMVAMPLIIFLVVFVPMFLVALIKSAKIPGGPTSARRIIIIAIILVPVIVLINYLGMVFLNW